VPTGLAGGRRPDCGATTGPSTGGHRDDDGGGGGGGAYHYSARIAATI